MENGSNVETKKNTKKRLTDVQALAAYHVGLTNAESHTEIFKILAEEGYDLQTLNVGRELLAETNQLFKASTIQKEAKSKARQNYRVKRELLNATYAKHRLKARLVFKTDVLAYEKLALKGVYPKSYAYWMQKVEKFYTELAADPELQSKLARMKLSEEEINDCLAMIRELESLYTVYQKANGDSQNSTKIKDSAIAKMNTWMHEFYSVSRLALKDQPQLLEALGKVVKS